MINYIQHEHGRKIIRKSGKKPSLQLTIVLLFSGTQEKPMFMEIQYEYRE